MAIAKNDILFFMEQNGFINYKTNVTTYYYKKDNYRLKIIFNKFYIILDYQNKKTTFRGYKNFRDYFCALFSINKNKIENVKFTKKMDLNKMHDINMILFHEDGEKLYYITRDLKILKKIFNRNDYNGQITFYDSKLTKAEQEYFKYTDLEDLWFRKVGYYEEEREKRLRQT